MCYFEQSTSIAQLLEEGRLRQKQSRMETTVLTIGSGVRFALFIPTIYATEAISNQDANTPHETE